MSYIEDNLDYFLEHRLGENDSFKFTCKQCGNCCRNRDEPVMITGVDLFYIARALEIAPSKAMVTYTDCYIGHNSKVPVLTLIERLDGSCKLLRNGKCTVHDQKPVVCSIYPLGRLIKESKAGEFKYEYFTQPNMCSGAGSGAEQTLKEWLDKFKVTERDAEYYAWHKMTSMLSDHIRKLDKDVPKSITEMFHAVCLQVMYIGYDTSKDLLEQIRYNMAITNFITSGGDSYMEKVNSQYKPGTNIRLISMSGESQMKEGLMGTVDFIDDIGQIHMKWENGSSLALIEGVDKFEVVK